MKNAANVFDCSLLPPIASNSSSANTIGKKLDGRLLAIDGKDAVQPMVH